MTDEIMVIVDGSEIREGILDRQVENCPTCQSRLEMGFGLAGGGVGVYGFCEPCGRVIWKCATED